MPQIASWYVTNDTLHHDLNVQYIRDQIKKFSQRYIGMEERSNIFATNTRQVKTLKRSRFGRLSRNF